MAVEFGTGKTILILAIVVGCFAVLWPKLFYPMLQASVNSRNAIDNSQGHHRQERPPHLRPDMLHPALRERGRAIPQSHIVPRVVEKEGRPGPIPGMRPPMGGAGHVVPAPKGSGTMGVVMPIYTIGIVVFFMYTVMKVMFKKPRQSTVNYDNFSSDPEFRKVVFSEEYIDDRTNTYSDQSQRKMKHETFPTWKTVEENGTKLGWKERDTIVTAISGLVAEADLQREILAKRAEEQNHSDRKCEDVLHEKSKEAASVAQEETVKKEEEPKQELQSLQTSSSSSDVTHKALRDETAPDAPASSEEEEEGEENEEEQGGRRTGFQHLNDTGYWDDAPTTTNYTTASAAAEATGSEETAADYSALELFGPNDDQQEELEDEEEEEEEEVWNGDIDSVEEESEDEHAIPMHIQRQHQRQR